ncbi:sce7726 family protein (plasmid) [Hymenobacter sp. BRD128]|uniref:sce7726 family protein n=1 Tax=Hymenobacter sp. BRD128 TaxID=2675878 RepID=UPI001566785E|nr:sce7726 family protein [Hymenobacter sp. BRD128]QKG59129.1 sce7726 family protein [Hymenobacter sp. BRD128]
MNDPEIRSLLRAHLLPCTAVLDELPIGNTIGAMTRADVVALGDGYLHGYEIKGDSDTLKRIPLQVNCYGHVFSAINFVVVEKHVGKLPPLVPTWVGLWVASAGQLTCARVAGPNPAQSKTWLAGLLWQAELVALLKRHDVPVLSRWRVWECWEALEAAEHIAVHQTESFVSECLLRRLPSRERRQQNAQLRRQG